MSYDIINEKNINKCTGYPDSYIINKIFNSLINDNFIVSYNLINNIITHYSYSLQDLISEIARIIINKCKIETKNKSFILINYLYQLSEIEYNLSSCSSEMIQLSGFISIFKKNIDLLNINQEKQLNN